MWRRLAPAVLFLLCASTAFAFNSNPAGSGGAVAGGTCTGGQFMTGITTAGVPVCGTPSGGAPFPPGSPPQITGYSALNTGEAQTMVGDGTLARSGANQTTLTVTQINHITPGGVCSAGTFASTISSSGVPTCTAPPAPAAASITDAMLANAYSGVGACAAGSVATMLTRNAAPTCTAISTLGSGTFAPLTNPAGGQNNYAPLANPTFTGTIGLPAGSITDAMHASPYSGVGACTAGTFASTLNRNAAPTCTAPPSQFTAGGDLSGTATSQTVIGIRSTAVPALASGYLHYTGTAFVWDSPATGSFAPTTNPAGGQNNYAPLAAPTFTGTVTTAGGSWSSTTLTAPTINATTAFQLNGVAFGGSCSAGSFVSSISSGVIPTCGANLGTLYAPLTNPAGGANNYAPIASPTFTGTVTMPAGSITDTMLAGAYSGVGACTAGQFVSTLNRNAAPTCTTPAGSTFTAGGDLSGTSSSQTVIGIRSTSVPALASGYLHYTGSAFVWDAPGAGSFLPINNPTATGVLTSPQILVTNTTASSIYWGTTSIPVGSLFAYGTGPAMYMTGGIHYNAGWISDQTYMSAIALEYGRLTILGTNTGAGGGTPTGSPPFAATIGYLGMNLMAGTYQLNGVNFGGTCSAGTVVTAISNGVIPTCSANLGTLYAPLTNPAGGQNNYAPIASPTLTGVTTTPQLVLTNTNNSSVLFGSASTPNGAIDSYGTTVNLSGGNHNNGTNWIADATGASLVQTSNNGVYFFANSGLTVGSSFTPALVATATTSGLNVASGSMHLMYNGVSVGGTTHQYTGTGGGGSYTTTSTSFVAIDASRLAPVETPPAGSIVQLIGMASMFNTTAGQAACLAIYDGATLLREGYATAGNVTGLTLTYFLAGDGASHTYSLQYASCGGTGTTTVYNSSTADRPQLIYSMRPDGAFAAN